MKQRIDLSVDSMIIAQQYCGPRYQIMLAMFKSTYLRPITQAHRVIAKTRTHI